VQITRPVAHRLPSAVQVLFSYKAPHPGTLPLRVLYDADKRTSAIVYSCPRLASVVSHVRAQHTRGSVSMKRNEEVTESPCGLGLGAARKAATHSPVRRSRSQGSAVGSQRAACRADGRDRAPVSGCGRWRDVRRAAQGRGLVHHTRRETRARGFWRAGRVPSLRCTGVGGKIIIVVRAGTEPANEARAKALGDPAAKASGRDVGGSKK